MTATAQEPKREGLRERKKRRTVNAIELSAVTFALEKGYTKVKVEEICEQADISRSTFFNYMPNREAAIFGRPVRMMDAEAARTILDEQGDESLLTAILTISLLSVGGAEINQEVAAARNRLVTEQPDCLPHMLAPIAAYGLDLTALVADWLEAVPSRRVLPAIPVRREAGHSVNCVVNAVTTAMAEMVGGGDEMFTAEKLSALVDEIATVAAELDEPRGA